MGEMVHGEGGLEPVLSTLIDIADTCMPALSTRPSMLASPSH